MISPSFSVSCTAPAQSELVTIEDMSDLYLLSHSDVEGNDDYSGVVDSDSSAQRGASNVNSDSEWRNESVTYKDKYFKESCNEKKTDKKEIKKVQNNEDGTESVVTMREEEKMQILHKNGTDDDNIIEVDV